MTPTLTIEEAFENFKIKWEGIHLMQYDDMLVYHVVHGFQKSAAIRANKLIDIENLPLIATPDEETNTFTIKFTK